MARWKGQAAHTTTGAVSVSTAHCQWVNCSAGIIEITMTGTASSTAPIRRWRREVSSGSSGSCPSCPSASAGAVRAGAGSAAVYPVCSTTVISSCGS